MVYVRVLDSSKKQWYINMYAIATVEVNSRKDILVTMNNGHSIHLIDASAERVLINLENKH